MGKRVVPLSMQFDAQWRRVKERDGRLFQQHGRSGAWLLVRSRQQPPYSPRPLCGGSPVGLEEGAVGVDVLPPPFAHDDCVAGDDKVCHEVRTQRTLDSMIRPQRLRAADSEAGAQDETETAIGWRHHGGIERPLHTTRNEGRMRFHFSADHFRT